MVEVNHRVVEVGSMDADQELPVSSEGYAGAPLLQGEGLTPEEQHQQDQPLHTWQHVFFQSRGGLQTLQKNTRFQQVMLSLSGRGLGQCPPPFVKRYVVC